MTSPVLLAFLKLKPREGDANSIEVLTNPELRARVIVQIEQYPAVALPDAENPVVVAGAVLNDEMAELWMVAGAGFEAQYRRVIRQLKCLIGAAQEALAPRKIILCVDPDRPGAERFVRALGFAYEKRKAAHVYTLKQKGKRL